MSEREWREASDMRQSTLSAAAVVAVGAGLRFYALGAGVPYAIGVDEPQIVDRAVGMMRSGSYNPHFFDYPTLYIYVQLAVAVLRFMVGAMSGRWDSLADVGSADFFLWGRAATATLGTATVLLVYMIGLRWGTRPALLAAGLMAVLPLHVRESHFVLTDVPVTFFVTLTFLLALRAHERQYTSAFAWAGASAGLAAATKYPGALALLLPLVALWMTPAMRRSRWRATLATMGASAGAFLLAAPYTLLDLPAFLDGYARLTASYSATPPGEAPGITYFKHLRNSIQWPALLLVFGGGILAIVRSFKGPGHVRWALAVIFPVVYFWFVSRQTLVFARYLLPLGPFISLLAATAVVSGVSLLRRWSIPRAIRSTLIVALTLATLLPATISSVRFDRNIAKQGTAAQAYEWIGRNVPQQSTIVTEPGSPMLAHGPFRIRTVRQLRQHAYAEYVDMGADYLIASSQSYGHYVDSPAAFPTEYGEYKRLFDSAEEVARFTASADHPGPELRILKVRR